MAEKTSFQESKTHHLEAGNIESDNIDSDEAMLPNYDDKETKRILRKVDWRLLPMLTLLYVLAFMDRSNIGNARVAGMNVDLGLTPAQYNICLTVFFFPYALFEVPSNIILKLMRPSWWICILVVSWGTVMTLQGIVQGYGGLAATRTMLGVTEAGFFPAATYLLTTWYCRWETQTRMALFFSAASLAGAFSGLLAFGIQHMDGIGGLGGWRWIFVLEGILTVCIGATLPWILPDSPSRASFLTQAEKEFMHRRLEQDAGTKSGKVNVDDGFDWTQIRAALLDWKIYVGVVIYWGNSICIYGFSFAAPTIILELGYTSAEAQLMTIPIYTAAAIATIIFARLADRHQTRWLFVVIPFCIASVGFIGLLSIPHPRLPGLTYAFLFFITCGLYPAVICCISWVANNLAPTWKRATGMASLMTLGNLGGAIGSNIFLANDAPHYWLGYGLSLGILIAGLGSTFLLKFTYSSLNKQRDAMSEDEIRRRYTEEDLLAMGDKSPLYRYVI